MKEQVLAVGGIYIETENYLLAGIDRAKPSSDTQEDMEHVGWMLLGGRYRSALYLPVEGDRVVFFGESLSFYTPTAGFDTASVNTARGVIAEASELRRSIASEKAYEREIAGELRSNDGTVLCFNLPGCGIGTVTGQGRWSDTKVYFGPEGGARWVTVGKRVALPPELVECLDESDIGWKSPLSLVLTLALQLGIYSEVVAWEIPTMQALRGLADRGKLEEVRAMAPVVVPLAQAYEAAKTARDGVKWSPTLYREATAKLNDATEELKKFSRSVLEIANR